MEYHYDSPLGAITLRSDGEALTGLWFDGQRHAPEIENPPERRLQKSDGLLPVFADTVRWLELYFGGHIPDFTPPLRPEGTPFQKAVWDLLLTIPYGQRRTYGEFAARLAEQMDVPHMSAQAVGGAVGRNPISLIIPCHRVIGANGNLVGYAGGLTRKAKLLVLERKSSIRWVFFDLGSTLIDETAADLHRIRDMTAGTGITVEQYQQKRLDMIRQGKPGDTAAIAFLGLSKTPWHSEDETPYPDAAPTLAELKHRGFRLGVIANQNPGTLDRLANWNLLTFFDLVVASSEVGVAKPDPAIFRLALEKAAAVGDGAHDVPRACPPSQTVMVGDRLDNDIAPANRLGMHTVRLLRGLGAYHNPQSSAEHPEHTIRKLTELIELLT